MSKMARSLDDHYRMVPLYNRTLNKLLVSTERNIQLLNEMFRREGGCPDLPIFGDSVDIVELPSNGSTGCFISEGGC